MLFKIKQKVVLCEFSLETDATYVQVVVNFIFEQKIAFLRRSETFEGGKVCFSKEQQKNAHVTYRSICWYMNPL